MTSTRHGTQRTYGSLFTGVGGFDLGFDDAGFACVFQAEIDAKCRGVLGRRWPNVPQFADVRDVDGRTLPSCDVLIFGSPCQDLSIAGRRKGLEGARSSMFYEACRIIKEMRDESNESVPRVVVWENVPGALTSNNGDDFRTVVQEMADLGALAIEWHVLDAQFFGVAQRRRRLFLVAVLDASVAERIGDEHLLPVGTRVSKPSGKNDGAWNTTAGFADGGVAQAVGFNWKNGGGYGKAAHGLGITLEGTGPLSTAQIPAVAYGDVVRELTPIECERLMGWPDDHTRFDRHGNELSKTTRYKMCGNGVASPVARFVAEHVGRWLDE